jgi:hypothetical protein
MVLEETAGEGQQQFNRPTTRVDSRSNELVVRQSPAGKNVGTEEEDIVGIRHQATTGEDIKN